MFMAVEIKVVKTEIVQVVRSTQTEAFSPF